MPSYDDFLKLYTNAAAAQEKAYGGGNAWAWLTGSGRDAAITKAQAAAPDAYFRLLAEQGQAQAGQLGVGQTANFMREQGFNVDPTSGAVAPIGPNAAPPQSARPQAPAPDTTPSPQITGLPGNAPTTGPDAFSNAIFGQESGNSNAAPTSANGAVGPGQLMPSTFAQYAKPGENINNPADNRAVSQRVLADLHAKTGGDPARMAVGYFSGPGNIAPAGSPTPWIHDTADANGKTVSSYVQDITQRLGGTAAPTGMPGSNGGPPVAPLTLPGPKGTAPFVMPQGAAAGVDPMAARRAFLMQQAQAMSRYPAFMQNGLQAMTAARAGIPSGTDINAAGAIVDPITGRPVQGTAQQYAAQGAGMTAAADANARVPAAEAIAGNQAALNRGTAAVKAGFDFSHTVMRMGTDGQLHAVPVSALDLANGKTAAPVSTTPDASANTYPIAENPYRADQQKDASTTATNADQATQGQAGVQQLGAAIKQFGWNGPWAQKALGVLENLNQANLLPPDLVKKVQSGELANMTSNTLVGEMVRQMINSRVPVSIYNQTTKNKPGLANSDPTLQLEALNQDFQRARDRNGFLPHYYQAHPFASPAEAQDAFDKASPIDRYESHVFPLSLPKSQAAAKAGYVYSIGGRAMAWDGSQFQPFVRVGE
jgi:hypothetical protein